VIRRDDAVPGNDQEEPMENHQLAAMGSRKAQSIKSSATKRKGSVCDLMKYFIFQSL
jgi:hypothetical protein